jgi:hypothetical protein
LLHHSPSWLLVLLLLLLHQYSLLLLLLLLELLGMPPPHGGIHIRCRPVFFRPHEQTRLTVYTSNKAHIQARQRGFQSHNVVLTHQDTTLCGLGCPSLLVEYSTIQVQRLVRALRDTTTHGFVTRAVLSSQLKATAPTFKIAAAEQMIIVSNSIRLKQLATLQCLRLDLLKDGEVTKTNTTAQDLPVRVACNLLGRPVAEAAAKASPKLLKDVMTLSGLGITSISHIFNDHTGYVIPASNLSTLARDAHLEVRPKHKLALNRLTKFIHDYTAATLEAAEQRSYMPYGGSDITYKDMSPHCRKPSPDMRTLLDELTANSTRHTVLDTLQAMSAPASSQQDNTDNIMLDLTKRKTVKEVDTSKQHADIRSRLEDAAVPCDQVPQKRLRREDSTNMKHTAMELWMRLPATTTRRHGVNDEWTNCRLLLLSDIAGDQDVIATYQSTEKPAASRKHKHIDPERPATKVTQHQALVQWGDTIAQQWVVDLSAQLGYFVESQVPATLEDVENIPQPCEYCVMSDTNHSEDA